MNSVVFLSIVATGFTIAFLHAAIPTHWLPFVMAARTQKWNRSKTLAVTALAGLGHVLLTTVLGVFIVWLGISLDEKFGHYFPIVAGGVLILFGLYYFVQHLRGHGHSHFGHKHHGHGHGHEHGHGHGHGHGHDHHDDHGHHHDHDHSHAHSHDHPHSNVAAVANPTSDRVAIVSLIAMLTFSPCEGFLPVYVSAIAYGWTAFVLLSFILAAGTLLGMVAFTWLTLVGMEKMKLTFLEKYESLLMAVVLCLLGLAVIFFEHQH